MNLKEIAAKANNPRAAEAALRSLGFHEAMTDDEKRAIAIRLKPILDLHDLFFGGKDAQS